MTNADDNMLNARIGGPESRKDGYFKAPMTNADGETGRECGHIWWERFFDELRLATQTINGWCKGCGAIKVEGRVVLPYHNDARLLLEALAALQFYATRENYLHDDDACPPVCSDEGDRARALITRLQAATGGAP